jgi:uroporphyrinogen decarboxylase
MNARERLLNTLNNKPVDRMPVAPFLYFNNVYELFEYKPPLDEYFFDPPDFDVVEKLVDYCDHFGFDVLHILGSVWDMYIAYNSINDVSVVRPWENWDVIVETNRKGDETIQRIVTIRTPEGELRTVEKIERTSTYLVVAAPTEYLIKTKEDFEIFRKYSPPADYMDCRLIRRAREAVGDKGLVTSGMHGAFNTLGMFRSLENILTDPITDPDFYREMIEFFIPILIKRAKKFVENGADVVEIAAHWTGQVGPKIFQEHLFEYENQLIKAVREMGVPVIYHNCGDAAKIMHFYNDLDINCWGYLTPPPMADVILEDALKLRPSLALRGNLDQVKFMREATPEEVYEKTKEVVLKAKERGNFILSTTDFFFDGTPYENIEAFAQAGLDHGAY